jgi:hypothetical protein
MPAKTQRCLGKRLKIDAPDLDDARARLALRRTKSRCQ